MKTFKEFVATNEHLSENVFDQIKNAATMYRLMTGIDKFPNFGPFKAPSVRGTFKTPLPKPTTPFRPGRSALGTAALSAIATKGADVLTKAANPQSWQQASKEIRSRQSQPTPFQRFQQSSKPKPETGVGTKPRVAEPYTPPRPRGMSNIPPAEAQPGSPSYVAPTQSRSVTTERPSAPRPKPSGPITTAQAGDNVGTPKSAISTYRDKADTKGLSVGRYKTLAQHRAAVAAQKNK